MSKKKKEISENRYVKRFLENWKPDDKPFQTELNYNMEQELISLIQRFQNDREDPKYLGIPNIQFSLTEANDHREKVFRKQRLKRGFDDSETWSLKDTITNFILPRLRMYRVLITGFIGDTHGHYEKIDLSIRAFEIVKKDGEAGGVTKEEWEEYNKGMIAFGDVFLRLWW